MNKIGFIFLLLLSQGVSATTDTEKKELSRIVGEISVIEQMVKVAQQKQEPGDPEQFQYEGLLHDLRVVKQGITSNLNQVYDSTYERDPLFVDGRNSY